MSIYHGAAAAAATVAIDGSPKTTSNCGTQCNQMPNELKKNKLRKTKTAIMIIQSEKRVKLFNVVIKRQQQRQQQQQLPLGPDNNIS